MNDGIRGFAMKLINERLTPEQRSSPQIQSMIKAIQENDEARGQQIASNLCQTMGVSKEDAVNRAIDFFGLR